MQPRDEPAFELTPFLKALDEARYAGPQSEAWTAEAGDGTPETPPAATLDIPADDVSAQDVSADDVSAQVVSAWSTSQQDVDWPLLDRLRATWRTKHDQLADPRELLALLDEACADLEDRLAMLSASLDAPCGEAAHDEATFRVLDAVARQKDAILRLRDLVDAEPAAVGPVLDQAQEAANLYAAALQRFQEQQQALLVLTCPRCDVRCPEGVPRCPQCGLLLAEEIDSGVHPA